MFVISPLVAKIEEKSDNIQRKTIDNELGQSRISRIPEMEQAIGSFEEKRDYVDVVLSSDREIDFIKRLEALADETGNEINLKISDNVALAQKQSASKKEKVEEDIKTILPNDNYLSMQITLRGDYSGLLNFIHKLENFHYLLDVISINATKIDSDEARSNSPFSSGSVENESKLSGKEHLKTDMELVVYLKKQ